MTALWNADIHVSRLQWARSGHSESYLIIQKTILKSDLFYILVSHLLICDTLSLIFVNNLSGN